MGTGTPTDITLITKVIEFDAGHRVPTHDGKCRCPHGHRYRLEATFAGSVPESGMVVDFGRLKTMMTELVHDKFDHRFVVWERDVPMLRALNQFNKEADYQLGPFVVVDYVPTAENLAAAIAGLLEEGLTAYALPATLHHVRLYETPNSWADYYPPTPETL